MVWRQETVTCAGVSLLRFADTQSCHDRATAQSKLCSLTALFERFEALLSTLGPGAASDFERVTDCLSFAVSSPKNKSVDKDVERISAELSELGTDKHPACQPTSSPQSPSRSDRPNSLLPTGRVICDDTPVDSSGGVLADIERRHQEQKRAQERARDNQQRRTPLPASGRIGRRRRRTRARPPNAEARRCPSPQPPASNSWRNGRDPPRDRPVFKCIDCRVWYTLAPQYHNHLASYEHEFYVSRGSHIYWCGVCRRTLLTSNDFNTHLASKDHWRCYSRLIRERPKVKVPTRLNKCASAVDSIPQEFQHE